MKKVMICLIGCFLATLATVRAQDAGKPGADSVIQLGPDTTTQTPAATATGTTTTATTAAGTTTPAMAATGTTTPGTPGHTTDFGTLAAGSGHTTISRDTTTPQVPDTSFRYHGDADSSSSAASSAAAASAASSAASPGASSGASSDASAGASSGASSDASAAKRKPDTLIALTDAPNAKDAQITQNQDTLSVKKSVPGASVEVKTVGASTPDTTKPDAARTDTPAPADQAKTDAPTADQQQAKDTASPEDKAQERTRRLDPRWFIGLKGQFQDFAFLEKNRKGYLSNANTLSFFQRGNTSVALSAYKNLTQRLSISGDLGLSFGHVTNNDVLISQTKRQTFNELNIALYYHLLSPAYRLQPYLTVGFNDIINSGSYPTVPVGIGAKFNARKVMILGQVTYGQSVSKSIASTTMYTVGVYIPIKSKKYKDLDSLDNAPYNRKNNQAKKKDSTGKGGGSVTNNIYITINMDSVLKAKGLLDDNGKPIVGNRGSGRDDGDDNDENTAATRARRRKKPFNALGLDDFSDDDYKIDTLDGKPVIRFVVYFEFNEYGLNSKAFNSIDKVIQHLRKSPDFTVEIKGYTDSVGSDPYNNMLSRRRAKMVLDYMNSRGVPVDLMKAKAYGRDNPVADNSDPNKAWLNRRAEIIIHPKNDLAIQ